MFTPAHQGPIFEEGNSMGSTNGDGHSVVDNRTPEKAGPEDAPVVDLAVPREDNGSVTATTDLDDVLEGMEEGDMDVDIIEGGTWRDERVLGRELFIGEAKLFVVVGTKDIDTSGFGEHEGVIPASRSVYYGFRNIYSFGACASRVALHRFSLTQLPVAVVSVGVTFHRHLLGQDQESPSSFLPRRRWCHLGMRRWSGWPSKKSWLRSSFEFGQHSTVFTHVK
jgi:hypothetical protein